MVLERKPDIAGGKRPLIGLLPIALLFLKEGNSTFGGGVPTVAALQRELVNNRKWLDMSQYSLCYVLSRITPGTNLLAFCASAGWILRGLSGALVAVLAGSIPSSLLVAVITGGFDAWSSRKLVQIGIDAVLAASVGILLASFWIIVRPQLKRGRIVQSLVIVGASLFLSLHMGVTPLLVMALAAVVGFFLPVGAETGNSKTGSSKKGPAVE